MLVLDNFCRFPNFFVGVWGLGAGLHVGLCGRGEVQCLGKALLVSTE